MDGFDVDSNDFVDDVLHFAIAASADVEQSQAEPAAAEKTPGVGAAGDASEPAPSDGDNTLDAIDADPSSAEPSTKMSQHSVGSRSDDPVVIIDLDPASVPEAGASHRSTTVVAKAKRWVRRVRRLYL